MGRVQVRVMEERDFDYAVRLTDMAEWGFTVEEFAWMKALQPEGCFTALVDGSRAGLATTVSYGDMGWMGNVIVDPRFRARGVGSELVETAIAYLQGRGARRIGLYSYMETAPFYERLGFTGDIKFTRLSAETTISPAARLSQMTEEDLPHAIALDEASFGARRDRLLHAIFRDSPNRSACYVVDGPNRFAGFVMAKVTGQTAEVGPLVCPPEAEQKAEELAEAALTSLGGRRVYMGVSQRSLGLYRRLRAIGFQEDFRVLRMWLGGESPKAGEASYRLMESLERG